MILLKKLGAGLNEQIAGLLHDVSHKAFSHIVDWVIGDPTKEDYQDTIHEEIIKNSEIPKILDKYFLDYKLVSNLTNFSLLEREAPSLCADRIDYCLRELKNEGENIDEFISSLRNKNGQLFFVDVNFANKFALKYAELQKFHWAGNEARARYFILAEVLKYAIEKKIISKLDLDETDDFVIKKLINAKDDFIFKNLNLLENGFVIDQSEEGILLLKKFRYIDPEVFIKGGVKKLSEILDSYNSFLKKEKENYFHLEKIMIREIKNVK